jgi:hypothetical protein
MLDREACRLPLLPILHAEKAASRKQHQGNRSRQNERTGKPPQGPA